MYCLQRQMTPLNTINNHENGYKLNDTLVLKVRACSMHFQT